MPFSQVEAELVALPLQSLVFGAFSVSYCITTWLLLCRSRNKGTSRIRIILFVVSTVFLILSIANLALTLYRALQAFIHYGRMPDGTANFYTQLAADAHIAQDAIYVTTTLIGDTFFTYRLFIIWDCNWKIVILPILLVVGTAGSGYGACIYVADLRPNSIFTPSALPDLLNALFALPLTTNVLLTVLIAGRIAWTRYKTRRLTSHAPVGRSYWAVVETLIQSAAIMTFALAALLGTYLAESNAHFIIIETLPSLTGFVFTLIVILVHARNSERDESVIRRSSLHNPTARRGLRDQISNSHLFPDHSYESVLHMHHGKIPSAHLSHAVSTSSTLRLEAA